MTEAFPFLIGIFVLKLALNFLLYWDESPTSFQDKTDPEFLGKTFKTFQEIAEGALIIFAVLYLSVYVGVGIKKHGFTPRAFLPLAAFTVLIKLFIWLFRDIFTVMKEFNLGTNQFLKTDDLLRNEFYQDAAIFDVTSSQYLIMVLVIGAILGMTR
jgi:predicted membrane protein